MTVWRGGGGTGFQMVKTCCGNKDWIHPCVARLPDHIFKLDGNKEYLFVAKLL